ncbi:GNAT family N-acetyltransferase [Paractinoplanes rishiriensis]|uniref:N-acetyltransferase n=1 Tax=Paractinoplanes rishiriensis TaxID=1050105 RepID=A0A919JT97_9ACTN|nr:N-acetyltransferase [Actinoplanes rishiriensis]GIE93074.1 N-acetyltransferase [Actinoplanes rishiriensis]
MTDTWTTRAETGDDILSIREINLEAFPSAVEADLVDALRADPQAWIDGLSIVAVGSDGLVVGYALLTRCHIGDAPALALAPCSVRPARQRTGAGSAAIRAALEAATGLGERSVVVLGHPTYYPRFGFSRASGHGIRVSFEVPDEALMVLALDPGHPLPAGTVRYPAPFGIE